MHGAVENLTDEDRRADADFNVVMTGKGEFVEVQGTAEGQPFSRQAMDELLDLAVRGIDQLLSVQRAIGHDSSRT